MRRVASLLISVLACSAFGDPPTTAPTSSPHDPLADSRRIDEELRKLSAQTPIARQLAEINARLQEIQTRNEKERQPLYDQAQKLRDSPAFHEYENKYRALEEQRMDKWRIERKAMGEAARRIYSARHEELQHVAGLKLPDGHQLGLDVFNYPRIDGSTSTHPLNVVLACRILDIPYEWIYPEVRGDYWYRRAAAPADLFLDLPFSIGPSYARPGGRSSEWDPEFDLSACRIVAKPQAGNEPRAHRIAVMINSLLAANTNTHDAYVNLIEGKCDLNLTARAPSEGELTVARMKNVKIAVKPIARDALVFIVNVNNLVKTISSRQLQDIYANRLIEWSEVGGAPGRIVPLWRERDSGSRELFDAMVMKGEDLPEPQGRRVQELYVSNMSGPYNRVTKESTALGYSVYYYEHFMAMSPYTRVVPIDGVEPTAQTIASGQYPLIAPVYAAYRETDPPDSPAMKLLAWLVSPEGQTIIRESGYVPVSL